MIVLVLLSAFFLRLINLSQSLWLDEAVQAITAQKSINYIFQEISGDFHPPLFHFLMHFWVRVFGNSEIALRMPSVLFGVGTIFFVFKIGGLIKNKKFALLSALVLTTAPLHIYYSQEARMYSMVTFFATLSICFFLKSQAGVDKNIKNFNFDYLWYFFATILMVYSDYYGFLIVLAQAIFLLIRKRYKCLILNTCFLILFYLPWLPMVLTQVKAGMLATQDLPEWGNLVNTPFVKALPLTFAKFSIGRITIFNEPLYAGIILVIGFMYGYLFLMAFREWLRDRLNDTKGMIIIIWFVVPLVVSWLASLIIPSYQPFRLLLILRAFYLILARGIEGLSNNRRVRGIAVGAVLLVNLVSLSVYFFNPYFYREDWRGVTELLKSQNGTALLPSETSNWPIKYYDQKSKINMIYGGTGVNEVGTFGIDIERMGNKVYYLRYLVPLFDPEEKIMAELNAKGYTKVEEVSFNQIALWKFEKK